MEISIFKENIKLIEVGKILKSVVPRCQYTSRKLLCREQGRGFCLSFFFEGGGKRHGEERVAGLRRARKSEKAGLGQGRSLKLQKWKS